MTLGCVRSISLSPRSDRSFIPSCRGSIDLHSVVLRVFHEQLLVFEQRCCWWCGFCLVNDAHLSLSVFPKYRPCVLAPVIITDDLPAAAICFQKLLIDKFSHDPHYSFFQTNYFVWVYLFFESLNCTGRSFHAVRAQHKFVSCFFNVLVFNVLNSSWALLVFNSLSGSLGSPTSSYINFLSSKMSFSCRYIGKGRGINNFDWIS